VNNNDKNGEINARTSFTNHGAQHLDDKFYTVYYQSACQLHQLSLG